MLQKDNMRKMSKNSGPPSHPPYIGLRRVGGWGPDLDRKFNLSPLSHRIHIERLLGLAASLLAGRAFFSSLVRGNVNPCKATFVAKQGAILPLYWRQCNASIINWEGAQLSREPKPWLCKMIFKLAAVQCQSSLTEKMTQLSRGPNPWLLNSFTRHYVPKTFEQV